MPARPEHRDARSQSTFARMRCFGPVAPERAAIEGFIAARYSAAFGARLRRFMPWLATFEDDAGELHAALGLRAADLEPLFIERYLDLPVEDAIGALCGEVVPRASIIEVGNFAARHAGDTRRMIHALVERLADCDYRYVVFAATAGLRNAFARLGLAPVALATADPLRLGAERADWGNYYAGDPQVLVGDLESGFAWLAARGSERSTHRVHSGSDCTACA
ncbi:MAG: thermostable hemolysin [Xanthomonadales bacterium]|nr:thermostable hemolysin [Xanthomonadales bacterium]